jgi:hypothetical protein
LAAARAGWPTRGGLHEVQAREAAAAIGVEGVVMT